MLSVLLRYTDSDYHLGIYKLFLMLFDIYLEKKRKKHIVGTVPKSNGKNSERCKIDTNTIQVHDRSLFWCDIGTALKSGGRIVIIKQQVQFTHLGRSTRYDTIRSKFCSDL